MIPGPSILYTQNKYNLINSFWISGTLNSTCFVERSTNTNWATQPHSSKDLGAQEGSRGNLKLCIV